MSFQHHSKPDLTEEDIQVAVEQVQNLPSSRSNLLKGTTDATFRQFAREVLGLVDSGVLTPMQASYCLAGYYLSIATEDETVIAIGDLACELESPESVVGRPIEPEWNHLRNLVYS